jgi:hypothetical protein
MERTTAPDFGRRSPDTCSPSHPPAPPFELLSPTYPPPHHPLHTPGEPRASPTPLTLHLFPTSPPSPLASLLLKRCGAAGEWRGGRVLINAPALTRCFPAPPLPSFASLTYPTSSPPSVGRSSLRVVGRGGGGGVRDQSCSVAPLAVAPVRGDRAHGAMWGAGGDRARGFGAHGGTRVISGEGRGGGTRGKGLGEGFVEGLGGGARGRESGRGSRRDSGERLGGGARGRSSVEGLGGVSADNKSMIRFCRCYMMIPLFLRIPATEHT